MTERLAVTAERRNAEAYTDVHVGEGQQEGTGGGGEKERVGGREEGDLAESNNQLVASVPQPWIENNLKAAQDSGK